MIPTTIVTGIETAQRVLSEIDRKRRDEREELTPEIVSVPTLCSIDSVSTLALSARAPSTVSAACTVSERLVENNAT